MSEIPCIFKLVDISKCEIDKPISVIFPVGKCPKESPVIKPLSEWIEEFKHES